MAQTSLRTSRKIIGVDCGTARTGWGVLEVVGNNFTHIASGTIETDKNKDMSLRLKEIYENLTEIIEEYSPQEMAIEDLFFFKNKKTVISVGQARGVIMLCGALNNLPTYDYTPLQVKTAVTFSFLSSPPPFSSPPLLSPSPLLSLFFLLLL